MAVDEEGGLATVSGTITNVDSDQAILIHNGQGTIIGLEPEHSPDTAAAMPGGYTAATFETVVVLRRGENHMLMMVSNAVCTTMSETLTVSWVPENEFMFRVTLTWDAGEFTDLDLHIWNPDGTHCGFLVPNVGGSELDRDDIAGYGPENITARGTSPGRYRVAVNAWALRGVTTHATVRVTFWSLAGNAFDVTHGPYLFEQDAMGAGTLLTYASYDAMFPITGDEPEWWRVCDVVVAENGSISVVPSDGVALEHVWTEEDWHQYDSSGVSAAGGTAGKRGR